LIGRLIFRVEGNRFDSGADVCCQTLTDTLLKFY
jgi:hypothetical protein